MSLLLIFLYIGTHVGDDVDHVFRCIDSDFLIPKGRPLICEYNRHNNHTYIAKCCKDKDLCNDQLNLELAAPNIDIEPRSGPTTTPEGGSPENSSIAADSSTPSLSLSLTVLLPSCIISGLLLFALFILVFMCRRKGPTRIKCICFECVHRGETGSSRLNLNGSSTTVIQGQNYNR